MAITRKGLDDTLIHYNPPKCLPDEESLSETWDDLVRCSCKIQDVTCPACVFYYYRPEHRGDKKRHHGT